MYQKIFLIVQILFFVYSIDASSQFQDKLTLKDGTEMIGEVRRKGKKYVVYRQSKKSEKTKYKKELVYSIERPYKGKRYVEYYKKIKGTNEIWPIQKHIFGKVEGYYTKHVSQDGLIFENYYVGKPEDDFVVRIKHGPRFKKFHKIVDEYFSDCPEILSKIKNLDFGGKADAIEGIINYYNQNCH